MNKKLLLLFIAILSFSLGYGQSVFVDDFNRADNGTVGNSWNEYTTTNGGQIYTNRLRLGSANSGRDYVTRDLSSLTNPIITNGLTNNSSLLEWAFNFKGSRTNPSGFNNNNYGGGFVLGNTVNNAIGSGSGYAVIIGQSGGSDPIRLAKFTGGVNANSDFTNIISSGDYGNQYISVRVTFDPSTDTWSLYAESNSSAYPQADPRNTSTLLGTGTDSTYTGTGNDLKYCGALYNHSGNNSNPHYYDDVYMPVSSSPTPTITANPTELSGFSYGFGNGPSNEQAFVIAGTDLTNDISISPDTNWEISLTSDNGGTFSATDPITLTPTAGDVADTVIYTRLKAGLAINTYAENITASSMGATDVDIAVEGMVYDSCSQLLISEYSNIVGGNYFEIYNPTTSNVDMSDYQIWRGYNGGAWTNADVIALSGTLVPGDTFSVARDPSEVPVANLYDSHMNYNGNDQIGLAWNGGAGTTYNLIDAVGNDAGDPGTAWAVAGTADATVNHTLVRKESVDYPNTEWHIAAGTDAVDSEWVVWNYTNTTWWHHVSSCQLIPLMLVTDDNANPIIIGSPTPMTFNHTLFPDTANGSSNSYTFEIWNAGNTELNLDGVPDMVSVSGGDAADFTITAQPTSPVGTYGGSTTFTVEFTPTAVGMRQTTVVIPNDNPFEDPYVFAIGGEAYDACSQLFISEYANQIGGNYIEIYNPTNANVDMADFQVWRGYNGGAWSGADKITLAGTLVPGNVYIIARDANEIEFANQYDSHLDFNGNDNIGLAYDDGSGTFVLIDAVGDENGDPGTGWDVAGVAAATFDHTLVRKSTVDYSNTDWGIAAGTNAADSEWIVLDYTITTQLYHVSDCQQIPLMAVVGHLSGAGNDELVIDELLAGPQTPKASNNTLFEGQQVGVTTVSHTFRIYNAGNTDLNLNGGTIVDITGANAGDFTVTTNPTTPVTANNGFTDFVIEFNPADYGVRTAFVSIANDNPFENPYVFTIGGEGFNYQPCEKTGTQILFEDFEDATVIYTTSVAESSDGAYDYFVRYDGTNIGSGVEFTNLQGAGYFGAQDTGNAPGGSASPNLELYNIDIIGVTNLDFSIFIAEDDNGAGQDWDANTYMHVKYRIDGAAWQPILWVEATDGTNSEPAIDNDFSGVGDLGNEITDVFQEVHRTITGTGSVLDIEIEFRGLTAGYEDIAIDNIELFGNAPITTTWDGIDWTTPPAANIKAIFDADYQATGSSINACACQVNDNVTVTVGAGKHLLIESDIRVGNGASIIVEHEGSVVQHNADATNTGAGTYTTKKTTTPYHEYDYTYWSSPTTTADLATTFVPVGNPDVANFIWTMNTGNMDGLATDEDDWDAAAGVMSAGTGYAVLGAAADLPFDSDSGSWTNGNTDDITFDGPFNNGDIPVTVVIDGDLSDGFNNQNLIGNPYPSAIDMTLFYNANDAVLGPNFHFWTHNTVISTSNTGSHTFNFTNNDYSTWNAGTGAVVGGSASGKTDNFIASAQGFLVEAADLDAGTPTGVVTFTNDMRVTGNNTNFLSPMSTEDEENRLWLNLTNDNEQFRQILVGFFDEATCGFDELYDGPRMPNGASLDFFSVIEGDSRHFAIQGMHTFDDTKIVTLGLEIVDPIAYSIEIDHFEGVFSQGQDIYIYDSYTNTIHDLATGAYHFTSEVGDPINDRLTVRFTDDTTGIEEWTTNANLVVSQDAVNFELRTSNQTTMNKVVIYNILGQQLDVFTPNATDLQISKAKYSTGTVLLVKVALENGQVVTQKVITL